MRQDIQRIRRVFKAHQIRVGRLLAGLGLPEYTILTIFSILMGTAAGFTGVGLHNLIHLLSSLSLRTESQSDHLGIYIIFIPAAGMLVLSIMTKAAPRQARQKGVVEIIKAVGLHCGRIPFRSTLFHFVAPAICIGTGGTVGPEAPAAQSGAGVVSALGRAMGLNEHRQRVFTAAGAGAAIAAIFNTPLAGVFFAIEVVLLHDIRVNALSAFLLASVSASTVSRIILGNAPKFDVGVFNIGDYKLLVFYLLLGIGAGIISIAFISTNEWFRSSCQRMFRIVPKPLAMVAAGLLMGLAGYLQPGIFGVGYSSMNGVLSGSLTTNTVVTLFVLKFFLVSLILGVGGFGGVFAPSMFMGACFGYAYAVVAAQLFGVNLDPTTYGLVGMGAVLAGINSVPLTAIMILFEMTNDYHFILPLMVGVVGSTLVVQMTLKGSIYARSLRRQGYHYSTGRDTRVLESIQVAQVMREEILLIEESTPLAQLIQKCMEHPHETIYTADQAGGINGVIPSSTLHELITEYQDLKEMVVAKDLAVSKIEFLREDDNLDHAMRMFARYREEEIPVASADSKVVGVLHYQDVLSAYNNAKIKLNLMDGLAGDLKTLDVNTAQDVLPGFSILEVEIPGLFVNKTLQQLRIRNRFAIDVLMIEKNNDPFVQNSNEVDRLFPQTNHRFSKGERIIIFGNKEKVEAFKEYSLK